MCGIAGFFNPHEDYTKKEQQWKIILREMNMVQKHRGPDDEGIFLDRFVGFAHVRLSIIDLMTGRQPILRREGARTCAIIFNGEIYNMNALKQQLMQEGCSFFTASDTEVVLAGYMRHGKDYMKQLNGIFAMAIWDSSSGEVMLWRDRLGIKPLFYTIAEETVVFASEIKGIFAYPGIRPAVDQEGLCEIFALGPAKTPGKGIFRGISEVLPGQCLTFSAEGKKEAFFWKLQAAPHEDSETETIEKTRWLLEDAVRLQMLSDIPISTFLSGGVDSSLVTAICAKELKKQGKILNTFSFDFQNNDKYFTSNSFQPSQDRPYAEKMVAYCNTNHRYLTCTSRQQADFLFDAVDARDLPCMADVESSMLYFCSQVVPYNKVTLTGECADEIFGGYPWFSSEKALSTDAFPWSADMEPRKALLKEEILRELPLEEYARNAYEETVRETPKLEGETRIEQRRREISWLNLRWFMVTLLDRMDRTSMYSGLEARVPFADHRIVEYLYNVPWEIKAMDNTPKGLLRRAGEDLLPKEILWRRKSPYPKTYDPGYEALLAALLKEVLGDSSAPVNTFLDRKKVLTFLDSPSDYGKPWYGQLMAGPQMTAYLLQVNYWLQSYHISIL